MTSTGNRAGSLGPQCQYRGVRVWAGLPAERGGRTRQPVLLGRNGQQPWGRHLLRGGASRRGDAWTADTGFGAQPSEYPGRISDRPRRRSRDPLQFRPGRSSGSVGCHSSKCPRPVVPAAEHRATNQYVVRRVPADSVIQWANVVVHRRHRPWRPGKIRHLDVNSRPSDPRFVTVPVANERRGVWPFCHTPRLNGSSVSRMSDALRCCFNSGQLDR